MSRVEVTPIGSVVCTQLECKCCVVCGCGADTHVGFIAVKIRKPATCAKTWPLWVDQRA